MLILLAQTEHNLGEINGLGNLGNPDSQGPTLFARFLSGAIGLMTVIAFIWFLFLLITGAIAVMTAGGDKVALENARKRITTGIIGLVIVIAAMFIIDLIATFLGVPDILDIGAMIGRISP